LQTRLWISGQKACEIAFVVSGSLELYHDNTLIDQVDAGAIRRFVVPPRSQGCWFAELRAFPGGFCGDFECLLLHKHMTDCITVEPCELLVLESKQLNRLCAVNPAFGMCMRQLAANRLERYELTEATNAEMDASGTAAAVHHIMPIRTGSASDVPASAAHGTRTLRLFLFCC
jgi:CRP-like cAMP-binding protein